MFLFTRIISNKEELVLVPTLTLTTIRWAYTVT